MVWRTGSSLILISRPPTRLLKRDGVPVSDGANDGSQAVCCLEYSSPVAIIGLSVRDRGLSLSRSLPAEIEFLDLAVEVKEMHPERCTHFVSSCGHLD
jgi:hypothetical protein